MKFRKKPVVIEAYQLPSAGEDVPHSFYEWVDEVGFSQWESDHDEGLLIKTLEGVMRADPCDWIIKGVAGEFYPCKPDIFAATYEPVSDDAPSAPQADIGRLRECAQRLVDGARWGLAGALSPSSKAREIPSSAWSDVKSRHLASLRDALAAPQPCWCHKCNEGRLVNGIPFAATQMIVCPICGNKRCPHASDHALACTASNDPIAVPAAPKAEPIDPHMIAAEDRFPDDDGPVILGEPDVLTPDDVRRVTRRAEPKRPQTCLWSRSDDDTDVWETACGNAFTINEGSPADNEMVFCCYCGRELKGEIGDSDAE